MKWTEENKQKAISEVLDHIYSGKSVISLLKNADRNILPAPSTFYEWVDEDEDLANRYARAMEARADLLFEEVLEIADKQGADVVETEDGVIVNHNVIQRSRLQVDARKWAASKMNPKKYGDKIDLTSKGEHLQYRPIFGLTDDILNDSTDDSSPEDKPDEQTD